MQEDIDPASIVSVPSYELSSGNTVVRTESILPLFQMVYCLAQWAVSVQIVWIHLLMNGKSERPCFQSYF